MALSVQSRERTHQL